MNKCRIFAVILAGGQSSRLYPFNKVLSDLTGTGRTLLQEAYDRLGLPAQDVHVLTTREMMLPIQRQIKIPSTNLFVDPVRRGTWPAILWAMAHLRSKDAQGVMAIVTGDHVIQGVRGFQEAYRHAVSLAQKSPSVVMMGIPPRGSLHQWLGFGCFRVRGAKAVVDFQEKPTLAQARRMAKQGGWQWNSGMFFFRIDAAEALLAAYQPGMFQTYREIVFALERGSPSQAKRIFENFPQTIAHPEQPKRQVDNSIDYAIVTPLVHQPLSTFQALAVQGGGFKWTDLGQWSALSEVHVADGKGNIAIGSVSVGKDVRDCILAADRGSRLSVSGIHHAVVAIAQKKGLVLPIRQLSSMKHLVKQARKRSRNVVSAGVSGARVTLKGNRFVVSGKHGFIPWVRLAKARSPQVARRTHGERTE